MKIQDIPNGLRISRAAVARILWRAIEAGADSVTLCAIIEFIARGSVLRPRSVNGPVFDEAIAEVTLAAQRSHRAREAAARRREARARAEAVRAMVTVDAEPQPAPRPTVAATVRKREHGRQYQRDDGEPAHQIANIPDKTATQTHRGVWGI